MDNLKVTIVNCYGIQKLEHTFSFAQARQFALYAPNGAMKSSFAETFKDISDNKDSGDRIFPARESTRDVLVDGMPITAEHVLVVEPYSETYKSGRVSTLLVNKDLRIEYDKVREEIDKKKHDLLKSVAKLSGLKATEERLSEDITLDPKQFFQALSRLLSEVDENLYSHLADIKYSNIFTDKVEEQLTNPDFRNNLQEYMGIYERLIEGSTFFKKGIFNHNNASDVAKALKKNGFFKAEHSVYVNDKDVRKEIKTERDLEKFIDIEKENILGSTELKTSFEKIDAILTKHEQLRDFRRQLEERPDLLSELLRPERLKQRLWIAYLSVQKESYADLISTYDAGRARLDEIIEQARQEATRWSEVLKVFNDRFSVPFIVTMENQEDVILKSDAPSVKFRFKDRDGSEVAVTERDLLRTLSNGEKRALYLLNVIFEVMARQDAKTETIFILDDVADSFDYKNKYAIVEYLRDITNIPFFYQIVLTHNYDFYRTFASRVSLPRQNKLHAIKDAAGITLKEEKYQNNPFNYWREQIPNDQNYDFLLASIPFFRNLAEYAGNRPLESQLTDFLHIKSGTRQLKISDLTGAIEKVGVFPHSLALSRANDVFLDVLFERADIAKNLDEESIELESKIVLSIAIRLKAEIYMIDKIADSALVQSISKNQTFQLIQKLGELRPDLQSELDTLKRVNLMTPENIHLNSFMYEPILDMANLHLKKLYEAVAQL